MYLKRITLLCFVITLMGCTSFKEEIEKELHPTVITLSVGDDGYIVHQLEIVRDKNKYSALEVIGTNFSDQIFSTLKIDSLNEIQLSKVKAFLIEANDKGEECEDDNNTSLQSLIKIEYKGKDKEIKGFCDWDDGYMELRSTIFGEDSYPESLTRQY